MKMVSKQSSQVWFLLLFGTVLALCVNIDSVSAADNKYCPAGNIERFWTDMICGDRRSAQFDHCQSWCADRGRNYTTRMYKVDRGLIDCVCCCGDALQNKYCRPGNLEWIFHREPGYCRYHQALLECRKWCRARGRTISERKRPEPGLCVCCCGDAIPPPRPPPSSTGSPLLSIAVQ